MVKVLGIVIAGALGTLVRFGATHFLGGWSFPLATTVVNLLGCFLIGLFLGWDQQVLSKDLQICLVVGFCGALTTFSTFMMEISDYLKSGQSGKALIYILVSLLVGLFFFRLGFFVSARA